LNEVNNIILGVLHAPFRELSPGPPLCEWLSLVEIQVFIYFLIYSYLLHFKIRWVRAFRRITFCGYLHLEKTQVNNSAT